MNPPPQARLNKFFKMEDTISKKKKKKKKKKSDQLMILWKTIFDSTKPI